MKCWEIFRHDVISLYSVRVLDSTSIVREVFEYYSSSDPFVYP